jgi:hypothetical protein
MAHHEHFEDQDEASGSFGLTLAVILGGAALLLLLGGVVVFFLFAGEARMDAVEDERAMALPDAGPIAAPPVLEATGPVITRERLTGARLEGIGPPPEVVWEFTADRFTLNIRGKPAPRLLLDSLLGKGKSAGRIEGRWQLIREGSALELRDIKGDGRPGALQATLLVTPTSPTRVHLANREYELLSPGQAPPAAKKD